ncbi:MAG: hypothetical protein BM557_11495 [Flavobacterium sp. MedPE-SWcel]|uniref:DUF5362 family protein n=1 Tax=uncultured Flavobacterium sp. TaxID=165435 RepID=UPI00091BB978|nr:DUF5362 family protein [uncultured Flavobacterium sp.]OIQ15385.1 MAG: hypothetical protein BM557_11495 [Flavobacterium sp. MedPE-SWcel]
MENSSAFDSFEMQLTDEAKGFLREAGKWAMFLSILGFIGLGFMLLGGISIFTMGSTLDNTGTTGGMPFSFSTFGIIYILMAILYFFPILYLYKFAASTKQAILNNNTAKLTESIKNLKSHYKFIGILTIITIVGYILGAIIMVAVVASAAV